MQEVEDRVVPARVLRVAGRQVDVDRLAAAAERRARDVEALGRALRRHEAGSGGARSRGRARSCRGSGRRRERRRGEEGDCTGESETPDLGRAVKGWAPLSARHRPKASFIGTKALTPGCSGLSLAAKAAATQGTRAPARYDWRRVCILLLAVALAPRRTRAGPVVAEDGYHSAPALSVGTLRFAVYLPARLLDPSSGERYPVVYFLHGLPVVALRLPGHRLRPRGRSRRRWPGR